MQNVVITKAAIKAAQIIAAGQVASQVIDEASVRTEEMANMLEVIDKSIPEEVDNAKVSM